MDINVITESIYFLCNTTQTGNPTPARLNKAYNMTNKVMYRKYFGLPENWEPGQQVAFSVSQQDEEIMDVFKQAVSLYINAQGYANRPTDFIHTSTITYITSKDGKTVFNPVKICNDLEYQEALHSYVVPADYENPVCNFISKKIRFAPKDLVNCEMLYLRLPVTPVWGFTIVNRRAVYDVNTSVQPEWTDDLETEFIVTAAQMVGVNMQRTELVQIMGAYKNNQN